MASMWWSSATNYPTFNHTLTITWATEQTSTTSHCSRFLYLRFMAYCKPHADAQRIHVRYIHHTNQLNLLNVCILYLDPMGYTSRDQGLVVFHCSLRNNGVNPLMLVFRAHPRNWFKLLAKEIHLFLVGLLLREVNHWQLYLWCICLHSTP